MKHATMLYRVPGPHETNNGVTFDYVIVDADEVPAYVKNGWAKNIIDAQDRAPTESDLKEAEAKANKEREEADEAAEVAAKEEAEAEKAEEEAERIAKEVKPRGRRPSRDK